MSEGLWQLSDAQLLRELVELETRMRVDYAHNLALIGELATRDVALKQGYPQLPILLRDMLRITRREATGRVRQAAALGETTALSGGTVPPLLPATAAAAAAGQLSGEHIERIQDTLSGLPATVDAAERERAEALLVSAAQTLDPVALGRVGRKLAATLDPDGPQPSEVERLHPRRELHLQQRRDGRLDGRFSLDPEAGALMQALLSPLAKPRPREDSGPDPRTPAERHGDALVDLLQLAAGNDDTPSEGGQRPQVVLTLGFEQLRDGLGQALLDGAIGIDAGAARRLACDCRLIPAVLGADSEPLDLGRVSYTVGTAQRRALTLRDGGCAFPGCDRRPAQCAAHHIRHWADGGPSDLRNLVLLCPFHHRLVHHSDWDVEIHNGRARFKPPSFIDPERRWRSNILNLKIA